MLPFSEMKGKADMQGWQGSIQSSMYFSLLFIYLFLPFKWSRKVDALFPDVGHRSPVFDAEMYALSRAAMKARSVFEAGDVTSIHFFFDSSSAVSEIVTPLPYCGFQISWRGGFFYYFFRSLLYFCARLVRHSAPQALDRFTQFLRRRNDVVECFPTTLSFFRNSKLGFSRSSDSVGLHLFNICVFSPASSLYGFWWVWTMFQHWAFPELPHCMPP